MGATVRPFNQNDLDGLIELWKEFMQDPQSIDRPFPVHAENVARWREFIERLVDEDPRQILVAEENGVLVGFVVFQKVLKTPLEMAYTWSYVTDLYVKPTHRRRGIGRLLLQTALAYLRSVGSEHVRLNVWHENEQAARLYRELGFRDYMHILQTDW